ncbi:MAG: Hsp20/alpha crystallin family protein [Candidatus Thermoplasmatota archaeon]
MVFRRKKDKIPVRKNEDKKGELSERRPYDLWSEMDRLFDQFRSNLDDIFWDTSTDLPTTKYNRTPPMDIADLGDKYEMNVEMPGISKDNVDIQVTPNSIEISAEEKETEENKGKNWLRRERTNTSFYRSLQLPEELNTDDVGAEMEDGVIKISLPKKEPKPEEKPKKVDVK